MEHKDLGQFLKQERIIFLWVNIGIIVCLACALVWEYSSLSELIPARCAVHDLFHIYCPGCGGTRAVYLLLHLHPVQSFLYHPLVVFVALILAMYEIGAVITLIRRDGRRYYYLKDWFCYVALGIIIVNWVLRNILLIQFHVDYIGDLLQYWQ
jgi:hypothetical protein